MHPISKAGAYMRFLLSFCIICLTLVMQAQVPPRPVPQRLYNNLSKEQPKFLDTTEAEALEEKLEEFSRQTSNQISVVVVDDLNGMEPADFATAIGNTWGVGKKGFNNGVVILIKPTGKAGQRDLFIATGYGLEGAIPDLATKRIREEEMNPFLQAGLNYAALDGATDVLMKLAKGEINQKDYAPDTEKNKRIAFIAIAVIVLVQLLRYIILGSSSSSSSSKRISGSRGGRSGWSGYGGGSFGGGGSGGKW